ncbi:iron uptake porin [Aetokthonos hydrillicola]|uniref:iron uptake porin n=2 Tax=Aetokthonos hydrillicola TaxID=1550245 RepID=UPI001ABA4467|nr:iron uptake porin [Aetokthonos hydrillicola]MBW4584953.1 iron uptake porin [Aetokthonos hydrillicola CCALA 1050]
MKLKSRQLCSKYKLNFRKHRGEKINLSVSRYLLSSSVMFGIISFLCNTTVFGVKAPPTTGIRLFQNSKFQLAPGQTEAVLTEVPQTKILAQIPEDSLNSVETSEQPSDFSAEQLSTIPISQLTSVSALSDVQPTDWAFQALQSLVERYGCIAGYPDNTFRGKRAVSRYEFAAGLNTCLKSINDLTKSATTDLLRREDLATIQKLQQDFASELSILRGRIDNLEAKTAELEARQFSATTKLVGEAVFTVAAASNQSGTNNQAVFQNRVRLDLQTSFTGKDTLHTRIGAGNTPNFSFPGNPAAPGGVPTATGILTTQEGYANDSAGIDWLAYYFTIGEKAQFYLAPLLGAHTDYLPPTNPYIDNSDGGSGALTLYGKNNSIYNIGGGTGLGVSYKFNNAFQLSAGYLAGGGDSPANPSKGNGLFNGSYSALGQLRVSPNKKLSFALTYMNSYHTPGTPIFSLGFSSLQGASTISGVVGTSLANFPGGVNTGVSANSYGAEASYQLNPKFFVGAWGHYSNTNIKSRSSPNGEIWNYAVTFAFPDLFNKGNVGGLIVGVEPYLGNAKALFGSRATNKVPLHVEAFYKYQLNNNISITPGVIYLNAPDQNKDADALIGVLRTTFTF